MSAPNRCGLVRQYTSKDVTGTPQEICLCNGASPTVSNFMLVVGRPAGIALVSDVNQAALSYSELSAPKKSLLGTSSSEMS